MEGTETNGAVSCANLEGFFSEHQSLTRLHVATPDPIPQTGEVTHTHHRALPTQPVDLHQLFTSETLPFG